MEDELNLTCLHCKHEEQGQRSCADRIKIRMVEHLQVRHATIYISEEDYQKLVQERYVNASI